MLRQRTRRPPPPNNLVEGNRAMRWNHVAIGCLLTLFVSGVKATPAAAAEVVNLPGGAQLVEVDFERHVAPLLGRLGCNAAACHGSFKGQGGLRLSLFGQSPELDFAAL